MTPSISTILKIGVATGKNLLESLRLEADRACRCRGERSSAQIPLGRESIIEIPNYKVKDAYCNESLSKDNEYAYSSEAA